MSNLDLLIEEYKGFILEDPIYATNAGIHEKDNIIFLTIKRVKDIINFLMI